eukprot:scaffold108039_cov21-Tisochrysis_lutea.AAC.1
MPFDFQPANSRKDMMLTWQCEIVIRAVDLMKETQQHDPSAVSMANADDTLTMGRHQILLEA